MNVQFDTCTLTSKEAAGLISLLSALFPTSGQSNPNPTPAAVSTASQPGPVLVAPAAVLETATQPSEPAPQAVQQPSPEPATRHRRTKAQIAADEAAKANPTQGAAQTAAQESMEMASAKTTDASLSASAASNGTAEELRALLNGYIQKHSMEAAIEILQSFECNRVTEALSLPADKLTSLAEALRG